MGAKSFVTIVLVLFLALLSDIFLVFKLRSSEFYLEFVLLCIFGIVSLMILFGAFFDEMWTWQLSTAMFTVMIVNFMVLRLVAHTKGLAWLGILVALIGFLVSIANIKSYDDYADELDMQGQPALDEEKQIMKEAKELESLEPVAEKAVKEKKSKKKKSKKK